MHESTKIEVRSVKIYRSAVPGLNLQTTNFRYVVPEASVEITRRSSTRPSPAESVHNDSVCTRVTPNSLPVDGRSRLMIYALRVNNNNNKQRFTLRRPHDSSTATRRIPFIVDLIIKNNIVHTWVRVVPVGRSFDRRQRKIPFRVRTYTHVILSSCISHSPTVFRRNVYPDILADRTPYLSVSWLDESSDDGWSEFRNRYPSRDKNIICEKTVCSSDGNCWLKYILGIKKR